MMKLRIVFFVVFCVLGYFHPSMAADGTRILVVVGPSNHPPGSHEVQAGGRLLADMLNKTTNVSQLHAEVVTQWPDSDQLKEVSTLVFMGDTFPGERLPDSDQVMREIGQLMDQGCGLVCIHYATGLRAEDVASDGDHPLLHWMGGYFATQCKHHQSIAKIYPEAKIELVDSHPITSGVRPFTIHDEPYINNYFGEPGNRLAVGVTAIAASMLPPENPNKEIVAWSIERNDSGRGFGIVMPHFYRNWRNEDLRKLILNGIVWSAKRTIPAEGVSTPSPELLMYKPAAVEPK